MTAQAPAAPQEGRRRAVASSRFQPPRLPLLMTVLKGWALTVLTLGAYRFWALAEYRSFMWRHLSLGGERVEYDGLAPQALMRFLIELAVAVPLLAALLVGMFVLRDFNPLFGTGALAGGVVLAFYLWQVRVFRTRQYLASHTLWRGIRCGMDGSGFAYGAIAVGGWIVVILTLGLGYPWMRGRCWAYQLGRARFGNRHFSYQPAGGSPLGAWLLVWLSVVGILIVFAGLNQAGLMAKVEGWREGLPPDPGPPINYLPLAALVVPALFYIRYRARELRFVANSTSFGRIDLQSSLPTVSTVVAVLLHWILVLAGAVMALLWLNRSAMESAGALESVGILFPLWVVLLTCIYVSVVKTIWLRFEIMRSFCRRLLIGDLSPLQMIEQYQPPETRRVRRTGAAMAAQLAAEEG